MPQWNKSKLLTAVVAAGLVAGMTVATPSALADPDAPDPGVAAAPIDPGLPTEAPLPPPIPPVGDPLAPGAPVAPAPVIPGAPIPGEPQPIPAGTPAGQNPTPFVGQPPFNPPTFNPVNGSMVGVAKPIYINFPRPIANKQMAQDAVHISSNPPVPGMFYWVTDTQLRWRPIAFWPANTVVNIDAAGTKSSFRTGDSLVATADNATHQMTISRNGVVEKTFPMSMGKTGDETKNGTYYVLEKFPDIVMDSSTYGVPVDSPQGYKLKVNWAVRIDNSGAFVHSAPWSVSDQGKRNVSHGCINLSPDNAKWFYDQFGSGDPIVVKNSVGLYNYSDGAGDWQWGMQTPAATPSTGSGSGSGSSTR
ncbi:ErfK/YbiS/YcfS/YnhG family protein [Mycobacteroides abscessus subsp. abscessus]|nr:ErfK/YbiS/YcfS/YnhG family protein [Mycobacteroides abscessus subsp. abscessus]